MLYKYRPIALYKLFLVFVISGIVVACGGGSDDGEGAGAGGGNKTSPIITPDDDGDDGDADGGDDNVGDNGDADGGDDNVGDNGDGDDGDDDDVNDVDGDGFHNDEDVDVDGDGLIEISTADELNMTRNNLDGSGLSSIAGQQGNTTGCGGANYNNGTRITACSGYELVANIDLAAAGYANWEPIGNCGIEVGCLANINATLFSANFNGNNHTISNLNINLVTGIDGVGLFGAVARGVELSNIHIQGGTILAPSSFYVGVLVGVGPGVVINSSSSQIDVIRGNEYVGGLVGDGTAAIINSASVRIGNIIGNEYVGGLVGYGAVTAINTSTARVNSILGNSNYVGGLVGYGEEARISSSSARVNSISGNEYVGGLVGVGAVATIISSSARVDNIIAISDYVGGLVGDGDEARISSSASQVNSIRGMDRVGGLVGSGNLAIITSSASQVNSISGNEYVGGLVGYGEESVISYSYNVALSIEGNINVGGLLGISSGSARVINSYWNGGVVFTNAQSLASNRFGTRHSTLQLQGPTVFADNIYASWASAYCNPITGVFVEIFSGDNIPTGFVQAWDLGNPSEYPALNCLAISPAEYRMANQLILTDTDGDGLNDLTDDDDDNDNHLDNDDNCPLIVNIDQADINKNGIGDACDDSDNDGVIDIYDLYPNNISRAGDYDSDGIVGAADLCPASLGGWVYSSAEDQDADGCRDSTEDVDDDGDGFIEISTADELNITRNNLDGSGLSNITGQRGSTSGCGGASDEYGTRITACSGYELVADINLAAAGYTNWDPIGNCGSGAACDATTDAILFSTKFNGNNHTISNLSISMETEGYGIGLFGAITIGAEISNVHIQGDAIYAPASTYVGALVGWSRSGIISSSSSQVQDIVAEERAGGLVGGGDYMIISSSSSQVKDIMAEERAGGLVGGGDYMTISSSSSQVGYLVAEEDLGGLVGGGDYVTISSSSAQVDVISGSGYMGGLLGSGEFTTISSSSAQVDSISGNLAYVGGLVGYGHRPVIGSSSSQVKSINGNQQVGGLVGGGDYVTISSSSAQVKDIIADEQVGGLVGLANGAIISYSYAITGSIGGDSHVGGLVGRGVDSNTPIVVAASYWDEKVDFLKAQATEEESTNKSTAELQTPTDFAGSIYAIWTSAYCNPVTGEFMAIPVGFDIPTGFNHAWDLGTTNEYPALTCLLDNPAEHRIAGRLITTDTDDDGISDYFNDADKDEVPHYMDNCPDIDNADQADSDNDGIGDACDN